MQVATPDNAKNVPTVTQYKKRANISIGLWLLVEIIEILSGGLLSRSGMQSILGVGFILLLYGTYNYVKGKGYHGAWATFGLLHIFGLAILLFFPDRSKRPVQEKAAGEL